MYQLSDKTLDRLSREASEQVDPKPSDAGWENLERKLDKELPQDKNDRRRFLLLLLFITALSGSGLVWTMARQQHLSGEKILATENAVLPGDISHNEKTIHAGTTAVRSGSDKIINKNKVDISSPDVNSSAQATTPANPHTVITTDKPSLKTEGHNKSSSPGIPVTPQQTAPNKQTSLLAQRDLLKQPLLTKQTPPRKKIKGSNVSKGQTTGIHETQQPLSIKEKTPQATSPEPSSLNNGSAQNITTADPQASTDSPLSADNTSLQDKAATADSAAQDKQVAAGIAAASDSAAIKTKSKKKKQASTSKFEIGITAGPDLSTVKYHYTDKPGYNAGLQIGYNLNNRWSLRSGIIYTKKIYSAKGKDFHPPKDYWINNYYLHKTTGNCFMLDIPINARYNITAGTKNKFYVSAGLSTYLMSKETYRYDYTLNGSAAQADWTNDKNSNFVFSILNASIGFEKEISKRFSFQTEPYLKAPLKGVGFGDMQMSSYGIYFSLIYKPSKK